MKKEFARKKSAMKQSVFGRWRWPISLCLLAFLLVGAGYFILQHQRTSPWILSYFSRIEAWVAERKQHWQKGGARDNTVKAKITTANKNNNSPPPIHFEFYTALPDMQVAVSEPVMQAKTVVTSGSVVSKKSSSSSIKNVTVVSAEELEQEFSKQLKREAYVVQLGVFRHASSAANYHKTIAAAGFAAAIVKIGMAEKLVYRVQLGPFLNKEEAKIAQKQLLKKGMNGVLLKS